MTELLIELTGTSPLAMHNIQLADPLNDFAKAISEITGKRKKTESDMEEIARLEFLGGLYYDPTIGVYVRTYAVLRAFEQAGKITRQGKSVMQGVAVLADKTPLVYEGPREPQALWERPEFRWRGVVGVAGRRVVRMRPIFRKWSLSFEAELVDEVIDLDDFVRIAEQAGRVEGLLEGRKLGNGRFRVNIVSDRKKRTNGRAVAAAVREASDVEPVRS